MSITVPRKTYTSESKFSLSPEVLKDLGVTQHDEIHVLITDLAHNILFNGPKNMSSGREIYIADLELDTNILVTVSRA